MKVLFISLLFTVGCGLKIEKDKSMSENVQGIKEEVKDPIAEPPVSEDPGDPKPQPSPGPGPDPTPPGEPAPTVIDLYKETTLYDRDSMPVEMRPVDIPCTKESTSSLRKLCTDIGFEVVAGLKKCSNEFYCSGDFLGSRTYYDVNGQQVALDFTKNQSCNNYTDHRSPELSSQCLEAGYNVIKHTDRCIINHYCDGDFKNYVPDNRMVYDFNGFPVTINYALHAPLPWSSDDSLIPNGDFEDQCKAQGHEIQKFSSSAVEGDRIMSEFYKEFVFLCSGDFKDYEADIRTLYYADGSSEEKDFNLIPGIACPTVYIPPEETFVARCEAAGETVQISPFVCHTFYCTGEFDHTLEVITE